MNEEQRASLQDQIVPVLESPGVLGTMPNIVANRLSSQFDFTSFGYAVSAEELSGIRALQIAMRALRAGEVKTAVVGAVDASAEKVHAAALQAVGKNGKVADGAFTLVLERLDDAQKAGREIYAILEDDHVGAQPFDGVSILDQAGEPHAASGLLQLSAAVLSLGQNEAGPSPIRVRVDALGDQEAALCVRRAERPKKPSPSNQSSAAA